MANKQITAPGFPRKYFVRDGEVVSSIAPADHAQFLSAGYEQADSKAEAEELAQAYLDTQEEQGAASDDEPTGPDAPAGAADPKVELQRPAGTDEPTADDKPKSKSTSTARRSRSSS